VTTRAGGVSTAPYAGLNLGDHVGDDPACVAQNRAILRASLPAEPVWLKQVHGIKVFDADSGIASTEADACMTRQAGSVCAVLTADCLPVLFCDLDGSVVAAAHAGWRGLVGGMLEATVAAMQVPADSVMAWLGPAIGAQAFEVGDEVREAFIAVQPVASTAFTPHRAWQMAGRYLCLGPTAVAAYWRHPDIRRRRVYIQRIRTILFVSA